MTRTPEAASWTAADFQHMGRALQLAALGTYSTPPNPAVGCVLLDPRGKVVGEGWHRKAGEPHAEVLAFEAADGAARGGTAYVTLEPCSHHGRTPPCADAVIAAGVKRVVAAMSDPNPNVAGAGLARLREAGITTTVGVLEREARELNRGFVSRMTRGRPWVTVKLGASLDGRTALADGSSRWITSPMARADVQRMRARSSAILTGASTVVSDNPTLNVREPDLDLAGRQPLRVIFDMRGIVRPRAKVVVDGAATLLLTSAAGAAQLQAHGVRGQDAFVMESLPMDANGRLDPAIALARLAERECNELLIEAGSRLAGSFLHAGLVDEIVVYLAPTVLGDTSLPSFSLPQPLRSLGERRGYFFHDVRRVGPDVRLTLRPLSQES